MTKTATMMWYASEAEAAAEHYVKALPNSKIIGVQRYGKEGPGPEGTAMVVTLELDGKQYQLLNGGPMFTPNESFSTLIYCDDQAEVDRLWAHFGEGGKFSQCGWLKDKWGFSWQIIPRRFFELLTQAPPEAKGRIFGAMMKMQKFVIADLEKAAQG